MRTFQYKVSNYCVVKIIRQKMAFSPVCNQRTCSINKRGKWRFKQKTKGSIGQIVGTTMSALLRVFTSRSSQNDLHSSFLHKRENEPSATLTSFLAIDGSQFCCSRPSFSSSLFAECPCVKMAWILLFFDHSFGEFSLCSRFCFSPRIHDRLNQNPYGLWWFGRRVMQEEPLGPFLILRNRRVFVGSNSLKWWFDPAARVFHAGFRLIGPPIFDLEEIVFLFVPNPFCWHRMPYSPPLVSDFFYWRLALFSAECYESFEQSLASTAIDTDYSETIGRYVLFCSVLFFCAIFYRIHVLRGHVLYLRLFIPPIRIAKIDDY